MSYDALKKVLEDLPDPTFVQGKAKLTERFAITLADGTVGSARLDSASPSARVSAEIDRKARSAPFPR